jgi:hypothetical protein
MATTIRPTPTWWSLVTAFSLIYREFPANCGGDVAAGLIGGLAAGTIIGAAVTAPPYYGPPPMYVLPAPYCYWTQGQPVWDPYRGVWTYPAVRVCE